MGHRERVRQGTSEEFVGRAVRRYSRREDIVLATKVFDRCTTGPGGGLSRRPSSSSATRPCAGSAPTTSTSTTSTASTTGVPVEETMEALHDVVMAGKVRYLGASSMWAWQFAKLQTRRRPSTAGPRSSAMQDQYNLLKREEEREMLPDVRRHGRRSHAVLAAGQGQADPALGRADPARPRSTRSPSPSTHTDQPIVEAVEAVAEERGVSMAQIAMAWVLRNPVVAAPIVGATKPHHLADAVAALDVKLSDEEVRRLEEPYVPQAAVLVVSRLAPTDCLQSSDLLVPNRISSQLGTVARLPGATPSRSAALSVAPTVVAVRAGVRL